MANTCLQQIKDSYVPLTFSSGFNLNESKLLQVGDSSLGNNKKYSQGGYIIFLCEDLEDHIGGYVLPLSFRSAKSKRVANSTLAAELLVALLGTEESTFIQTWLHEMRNPHLTALDLINTPGDELIPLEVCTDAHDLLDLLVKPGAPNITNRNYSLHLAVLRELREQKRVRQWIWLDTDDMIANGLTKMNDDGSLPIEDLHEVLRTCYWKPSLVYKYGSIQCAP